MTTTPEPGEIVAVRDYYRQMEPSADAVDALRRRTLYQIAATAARPETEATGSRGGPSRRIRPVGDWMPGRRWALPVGVTAGAVAVVAAIAVGTALPTGTAPADRSRDAAGQAVGDQAVGDQAVGDQAVGDSSAAVGSPAFFRTVSSRAARVKPAAIGSGAFVYTHTRSVVVTALSAGGAASANGPAGVAPAFVVSGTLTETWSSADGLVPLKVRQTTGLDARPLTAADAARLGPGQGLPRPRTVEMAGADARTAEPGATAASRPDLTAPTRAYLASLPTDTARLLARIRAVAPAGGKWSADQVAFEVAGNLLTTADSLLPPTLRSALFRVLGELPGVRVIPGQTDLAGRSGVAVTRTESGVRREVIVDPRTARALGTREIVAVATVGGPATGTVLVETTATQQAVARIGVTS